MRRSSLFSLVCLCLCASAYAESTQNVDAKIAKVTVFMDKAQVTRTDETKVTEGLNVIRVPLKEYAVDADSLTAKVFAEGELYAVQYRTVNVTEAPQTDVRALEETLRKQQLERK